jgi:putative restriction endonuclease
VSVTDIYQRRCAITGQKTLPILDAAHIRPFSEGGEHATSNGLLLRTEFHRLFDFGYVTVTTDGKFEVGRLLKEGFENGRHYYATQGEPLFLPNNAEERPTREVLEWHQTNRFFG